jgi:hypothetical protein
MVLPMVNAARGINASYLIRSLKVTFPGGGFARYEFECGDYLPDLYAMLRELDKKASGVVEWREDEVLDNLLQYYETLALLETTAAPTATYPPYYWGSYPSKRAYWNFAKYGESYGRIMGADGSFITGADGSHLIQGYIGRYYGHWMGADGSYITGADGNHILQASFGG